MATNQTTLLQTVILKIVSKKGPLTLPLDKSWQQRTNIA